MLIAYKFIVKLTRLYRATVNGFQAAQFHALCNDKGPTLSLIRTTAGHIFGGFTTISWDSSNGYKNDTHSFLFSVDKQIKFPIVNSFGNAINCTSSYGPTFGSGCDLYVSDNSN